jgi:hypothetical protein
MSPSRSTALHFVLYSQVNMIIEKGPKQRKKKRKDDPRDEEAAKAEVDGEFAFL